MTTTKKNPSEAAGEPNSLAQDRLGFLLGKTCTFRVWWTEESRLAVPGAVEPTFQAVLENVIPLGRDYYFVILRGEKRSILKTAVVLEIAEI